MKKFIPFLLSISLSCAFASPFDKINFTKDEIASKRFERERTFMTQEDCQYNIHRLEIKGKLKKLNDSLVRDSFENFKTLHKEALKVPKDSYVGVYCGFKNTEHALTVLINANLYKITKAMPDTIPENYNNNLKELKALLEVYKDGNKKEWFWEDRL